jgi:hypothetical protein
LLQGWIKYCKRDDKQISDWQAEYEDAWGSRVRELVEWKPSTPPSTQHRHSPTSPVQQSPHLLQQQLSHRRTAETWSSNSPKSSFRPTSHQHDLSYNRRSPSDSTPAIPLGRPRDDLRLHNNSGAAHDLSSHPQPQSDRDGGGRVIAGPPGKAGNEGRETIARRSVHDSDIDPALKDVVNGVGGPSDTSGGRGDNVESRDAGGSGDGPQSLPSLKSSGLLDWTSRKSGGELAHNNAPSHPHTNSHPYPHAAHGMDVRSTSLVSTMPVGLQWLANESR